METKIFDYKGNRVVVSFGVYGGGGNNRKVRYIGEKNIMDLISLRDGELFQREDGKYYSCNGDEMNMEINEDGLTGYIDFDGDYDTINACYFDELDEDSLKLIREDGAYIPSYMEEHIKNVLDKRFSKEYWMIGDDLSITDSDGVEQPAWLHLDGTIVSHWDNLNELLIKDSDGDIKTISHELARELFYIFD
jgi:hypothetical protein